MESRGWELGDVESRGWESGGVESGGWESGGGFEEVVSQLLWPVHYLLSRDGRF